MNGRFVLQTAEPLTQEEQNALQYLLADALSDFRIARGRGDAVAYVRQRYPETCPEGTESFYRKVEEVELRLGLARKLHNAALAVEVQPVEEWLAAKGVTPGCPLVFDDAMALLVEVQRVFGDEIHAVVRDSLPDWDREDESSIFPWEGL